MKLLKRKILFILASEADFFSKGEGFEHRPYKFLYERLGSYSRSSIRGAALQLVEAGEIDRIIKNDLALFRLTARGRERLLSFFPISIGQKKAWDRTWRIAVISPVKPNSKQKKELANKIRTLRRSLRKKGFKKFSRGIYFSPLQISKDIKEYLLKNDLLSLTTVIESRDLLVGDNAQLAWQLWKLDKLAEDYNRLIKRVEELLMVLKRQKKLSNKSKIQFSALLSTYFSLLEVDPGLPKKLLPAGWPVDTVRQCFLKLAEKVSILEKEQNLS